MGHLHHVIGAAIDPEIEISLGIERVVRGKPGKRHELQPPAACV